jgi:hypothetical protein
MSGCFGGLGLAGSGWPLGGATIYTYAGTLMRDSQVTADGAVGGEPRRLAAAPALVARAAPGAGARLLADCP